MLKDKKVLGGGAVLFVALFWFFIKPHFLDSKPVVPPTEAQIAAAYKPTIVLGKPDDPKLAAAWTGLKMNLKGSADEPHYALTMIALEFEDPKHTYVGVKTAAALDAKNAKFAEDLSPVMNQILDATTGIMASKSVDDVQSPEGRQQLAAELADAINAQLKDEKVDKVYFPTLITQ